MPGVFVEGHAQGTVPTLHIISESFQYTFHVCHEGKLSKTDNSDPANARSASESNRATLLPGVWKVICNFVEKW